MSYWSSITKTLLVFQQLNINNHHGHLDEVGGDGGGLTVHHRHSPITLLRYLEIVAAVLLSLGNNSWGSSISSIKSIGTSSNWGSSISMSNSWGSSISMSNSWGGGISNRGNSWGSSNSSNWDLANSVDWGVDSLADSLDRVGSGLVNNWLADGLVGSDWSMDGLGSKSGDVLEDWLGSIVSLDNGGWLVGGNWGRNVGVGGLSDGVGQGGDLGGDLSKGMGLSSGVGKVSSQSVVLNAGGVMSGSSDEVWSSSNSWGSCHSWSNSHSSGSAESDQAGEKQEGVHGGCC